MGSQNSHEYPSIEAPGLDEDRSRLDIEDGKHKERR